MKPRIKISTSIQYYHWWICEGKHCDGYHAFAFGMTPQEAFDNWKEFAIPF